MKKHLVPRNNTFALDVLLVENFIENWKSTDLERKDNLNNFLSILDFTTNEIKDMYITGDDFFLKRVKDRFENEKTLEEAPSLRSYRQNNSFFRTLHNNYIFHKEHPSLSSKCSLQFFKSSDLLEKKEVISGRPREWYVYFYSNIENDDNNKILDACKKRCVPVISKEEIENSFEALSHPPDSLKKKQKINPATWLKSFQKNSKFFIVYDRYIFNNRINRKDVLFGFLRKKISDDLLSGEYFDKYIDKNKTFKISENEFYENHISRRHFNEINHNILFFLKIMESSEIDNDDCFIIGCNQGNIDGTGKTELEAYFNAIDQRIEELGTPLDDETDSEIRDLMLIKKFKKNLLLWSKSKDKWGREHFPEGIRTGCGHNRLLFNDYALLEWGDGKNAFERRFYNSTWNVSSQQNISSKTLFNAKFKKRNWKKDKKNSDEYTNHYEALLDFCIDFRGDVLPKCNKL